MKLRAFVLCAVCAVTLTLTSIAQVSINASLRGRIGDANNANIAGATVMLTNAATAITQKATSDGNGDYQFARIAPGVYTLAYTFAQSRDTTSREVFGNVPTLVNLGASAATGFQGGGAQFAPRPLSADWGLFEFDVRHNLTISHLVELPFGKGRKLLSDANGFVNAVLGGWSLAGLAILRSGEPFNVVRGIDYNDDGDTANDRPALLNGNLNDLYASGIGRTQYLLPQADALTRLNTPGNVTDPFAVITRNAYRAPRIAFYDLSLFKQFQLTEKMRLGFEANAFNLFNRANFSASTANLSSALFGRITSTRVGTNPRQIQFGLKLSF